MKKLFVVKEKIEYEGDNIWIVAADSSEEVKQLLNAGWVKPKWYATSISQVSDTSQYTDSQIVWSNN